MIYVWTRRQRGSEKINKVVPVLEQNWNEFSRNMFLRGYYIKKVPKPPAKRTLRRWKQLGKAKSINGSWIPYEAPSDSQNNPSWTYILGLDKNENSR